MQQWQNLLKPLTETRIKLLKPKQTPYSDGNNLYLHVYNANKKTFLFWYTDPISKKRLKRKIGEHPDLSLEEARETTRRYNKLISKGLDPFQYLADQAKEEEKQKITLYEFAQIWKDTKITRKEKAPKAHIVPLSSQAIFYLKRLKNITEIINLYFPTIQTAPSTQAVRQPTAF